MGAERQSSMSACLVDIETDTGLVGHGFTAITEEDVIARDHRAVAGPAIIGDDPLAHERIWDKLYWTLMPRGQTGYAAHALAAIDVALWDIKGKALQAADLAAARRRRARACRSMSPSDSISSTASNSPKRPSSGSSAASRA